MMTRISAFVIALALLLVTLTPQAALAAKGGNSGKPGTATNSFSLVLLDSTDGVAHHGQRVTFNVTTTATSEPHVSLDCYQGGTLVYGAVAGFFDGYPWPWSQIMPLSSAAWSGGAADCVAKLYYFSGTKTVTLSTLNFHVEA